MPDELAESLAAFEGALAWETGEPRGAAPDLTLGGVRRGWLAGWDWADSTYGARSPCRLVFPPAA